MKSRINDLLKEIELKKNELIKEYEELKDKYDFSFKKWKVIFTEKAREYNKRFKDNVFKYILKAQIRHILSIPFIYMVFLPVVILDIFLFIYQQICFRLYWIPLVKRGDYITYDRRFLDYLNLIQKFNCIYCSYVNGFMIYATEVVWRTEKYWCPIKNAKKTMGEHEWQKFFADYWDAEEFKKIFNDNECFSKKTKK